MFDLSPAVKLCLEASAPAVQAEKRLMAGNVTVESAEDMRSFVMDLTGNPEAAEAAVLAWRQRKADKGEQVV